MKFKVISIFFLLSGILAAIILGSGYSLCKSSNHPVIAPRGHPYGRVEIKNSRGGMTVAWILDKSSEKGFVFAHGNSSDRNSMVRRMDFFASLGYSVIAVDLNAHGETKGDRKTFGYRESQDIEAAAQFLRKGLGVRWIGANGSSLGGASILKAVSNGCDFDAVIIESVFSDIRTAARNRLETRFGLLGGILEPLLTAQIPVWIGIPRDELSPSEWAEKCHAPTLVLSGGLDSRAKPWEARAIFDRLPTASKRIRIIAGAGHQDLFDFDYEAYRNEILTFLSSIKTSANETTADAKRD